MKHIFCCSLLFVMPLIASEIEDKKENRPQIRVNNDNQTNNPEKENDKGDGFYKELPESHKGYSPNSLVEFYLNPKGHILSQKN